MSIFTGIVTDFRTSRQEMKKTSTLTTISLLLALSIVLSYFTITLNESMKIGFSSVPIALIGMLFGPVGAGVAGGVADLIKFMIHPTGPYFPGFTISNVLVGVLFGVFLYRKKPNWKNVLISRFCVTFFVNILLNSVWLKIMYGQALLVMLPARIIKNVVMFPVEAIILYVVAGFVWNLYAKKIRN